MIAIIVIMYTLWGTKSNFRALGQLDSRYYSEHNHLDSDSKPTRLRLDSRYAGLGLVKRLTRCISDNSHILRS